MLEIVLLLSFTATNTKTGRIVCNRDIFVCYLLQQTGLLLELVGTAVVFGRCALVLLCSSFHLSVLPLVLIVPRRTFLGCPYITKHFISLDVHVTCISAM